MRVKKSNVINVAEPSATSKSKERILNVFIVDASGSMSGGKYFNAINGVNELLKSITQDTDTNNNVLIVEFEQNNIKRRLLLNEPVPNQYVGMGTGGMTPLNQAIGETLEFVDSERSMRFGKKDKVLVSIFTDGGENSSKGKYSKPEYLSNYIKKLQAQGFTINFIGTQNEVNYAIQTLGMDATNTNVHDNTARGISSSFDKTLKARVQYSKSVSKGEDVVTNFYTKTLS